MNSVKHTLYQILIYIRKNVQDEESTPHFGLCECVDRVLSQFFKPSYMTPHQWYTYKDSINKCLNSLFEQWPLFSGNIKYPITIPGCDPSLLYFKSQEYNNLYSKNTEYGRLRRLLLDYMINELKKFNNLSDNERDVV